MDIVTGKKPLLGMNLAEMVSLAVSLGMPSYAGRQIAGWVYSGRAAGIGDMTDLSKENRRRLEEVCVPGFMPPAKSCRSADGTVKYLFPTSSGKAVETVYIPEGERATLCVSCQVGCKMNCLFCQTGKQGFGGNLTAGDILNQVFSLPERESLTNIVFMGQGEPSDNPDAVLRAAEILQAPYALGWSPKRVTISTAGLRKGLGRLVEETSCHIAVSLHAARPQVRERLMPAEKATPVRETVEFLRKYDWSRQRRLTFEYIVFDGVNDTEGDAAAVASLLSGLDCRVNLIRFHEIAGTGLRPASQGKMEMMEKRLVSRGIVTTIRKSRGQDISAACGLLSTAEKNRETNKTTD